MTNIISHLTSNDVSVMGHVGLQPQSVKFSKDYKAAGKTIESKEKLLNDIRALEKASAFSVVLECMIAETAHYLIENSKIKTIGIGASSQCDGQTLVTEDILGLSLPPPPGLLSVIMT